MPETDPKAPPDDDDRYQTDTFSRGDAEGKPAKDPGGPDEVAEDPRMLEAGAAGGYQTDAFSRNDEEGVPQEDLDQAAKPAAGASDNAAGTPPKGTHLKAVDDTDSRDAPPMKGPEGGVR
jgi:hypothetical protein